MFCQPDGGRKPGCAEDLSRNFFSTQIFFGGELLR